MPFAASGRHTFLRRLGALLALVAIGEAVSLILIGSIGDPRFVLGLDLISFGFVATVVLYPLMGALIIQRRPFTRVAWLMIVLGLMIGFALITYAYGVVGQPPRAAWALTIPALVLSQLFFIPAIGTVTTVILLIYPTDHVVSPRWRWLAVVAVGAALAFDLGTLFHPGAFDSEVLPGVLNPLGAEGNLGIAFGTLADAANAVGLAALILAVVSLVLRYRRADPIVAAQIRWLALVAVLGVAALGVSFLPLEQRLDDLIFGAGLTLLAAMPIAIGIAISRYRLYDIDRLINRALVYGALTAILAGVFTAAVGLAQRLFVAATGQTSDAAIVGTTLVVATLYAPLRKRLEGLVDRRFKYESPQFGAYRADLYAFLSLAEPDAAARRLAREAAAELESSGVAVEDRDGSTIGIAGVWPQPVSIRLPIGRGETSIGALLVGPRQDGQPHDALDVAAVAELALLVGAAATRGLPRPPVSTP